MRLTKAELARLAGAGATIRRRPTFGKCDRKGHSEPTMAPTHGLTPAITAGANTGLTSYLYFCRKGVALATWSDERDRVPIRWLTWPEWASNELLSVRSGLFQAPQTTEIRPDL